MAKPQDKTADGVSSMRLKYDSRSKSSLGSILEEYGLPKEKKQNKKKGKEFDERLRRQRSVKKDDVEDDAERERRQWRDKKSQQVMMDLEALKRHYYKHYMNLLNQRVKKQQKDIKKKTVELQNELDERVKRERPESQPMKPRLVRSNQKTDEGFQGDLPRSHFHDILTKERQLISERKFRTVSDYDAFWSMQLKSKFPDDKISPLDYRALGGQLSDIDTSDVQSSHTDDSVHSMVGRDAGMELGQILEVSESQPASARGKEWAVTQQAQHVHKQPSRRHIVTKEQGEVRRGSVNNVAKKAKEEMELHFPKVEMPKLHCFTMSLAKLPPDPIEEKRKADMAIRERDRKIYLGKLQKMYQLAMANKASANRILERRNPGDLFLMMDGPTVHELTTSDNLTPMLSGHPGAGEDFSDFFMTNLHAWPKANGFGPIPEERESEMVTPYSPQSLLHELSAGEDATSGTGRSRSDISKSAQSLKRHPDLPPLRREQTIPLTLDEVTQEAKIIEAKCLSTLWDNYMRAGRIITAES